MGQQVVKELRNQKGWSQSELSALSGLSVKTIQRIEHGQGAPSLDTAKALASVFDRPFLDFIPSTETSAQQHRDSAEPKETASSQESVDVHANLLHDAKRYWRFAVIALFLVPFVGFLAKLYLNVEALSAEVSEIAAMRNIELASDSSKGSTLLTSNLQREIGDFSDYYGDQARQELLTYEGEEGKVRGVSLLELQMLRDIARIVSAWEGSAGSNPDIRSPIILRNNLQCYSDSRTQLDSASEGIAKMHDCIYVVLSDDNWQVDYEVDQAFKNIAHAYQEAPPSYKAARLVSPQITQQ